MKSSGKLYVSIVTSENSRFLNVVLILTYRAFHNVLHDYNIYNKKTKGPT